MQTKLRLEYLDPVELKENPFNYRTHPANQTKALSDVIQEVGWAGALLYNEKTQRLIDGHCRRSISKKGEKVPVLIGSWTKEQEKLILATLDPISAMAGTDQGKLDDLLQEISIQSEAVQQLLESMRIKDVSFDDIQATEFPQLKDSDKEFFQMAFSVTKDQKEVIEQAIQVAKNKGPFADTNPNSNGNALARIAEEYVG